MNLSIEEAGLGNDNDNDNESFNLFGLSTFLTGSFWFHG